MKIKLYLTMYPSTLTYLKPADLEDPEKIVKHCQFSNAPPHQGSTSFVVGEMEVDVDFELLKPDAIIGAAAVGLRQQAADIRAKAHKEAGEVEELAQQLLAIEYKP